MSLKHALNSGVKTARDAFNQTKHNAAGRNFKIFQNVRDLALAFQDIKDQNNQPIFEMRSATLQWGHMLVIHPADKSNAGMELEFFDHSDLFTVYTPQASNPRSKRVAVEMTSEQDALEALAKWAGQTAPDAQKALAAAIDNFELQRSITNGEWDCAPAHT